MHFQISDPWISIHFDDRVTASTLSGDQSKPTRAKKGNNTMEALNLPKFYPCSTPKMGGGCLSMCCWSPNKIQQQMDQQPPATSHQPATAWDLDARHGLGFQRHGGAVRLHHRGHGLSHVVVETAPRTCWQYCWETDRENGGKLWKLETGGKMVEN